MGWKQAAEQGWLPSTQVLPYSGWFQPDLGRRGISRQPACPAAAPVPRPLAGGGVAGGGLTPARSPYPGSCRGFARGRSPFPVGSHGCAQPAPSSGHPCSLPNPSLLINQLAQQRITSRKSRPAICLDFKHQPSVAVPSKPAAGRGRAPRSPRPSLLRAASPWTFASCRL